jgi:hypothetical protein
VMCSTPAKAGVQYGVSEICCWGSRRFFYAFHRHGH